MDKSGVSSKLNSYYFIKKERKELMTIINRESWKCRKGGETMLSEVSNNIVGRANACKVSRLSGLCWRKDRRDL